jgi:hypothetical protein
LAGRSGYGRAVKARRGAAALMAAAAMAAPAQAQMRGTAGGQTNGLAARPLTLPRPAVMPTFVVDPTFGLDGAEVDLSTRQVRSGTELDRFSREHETFHVLDNDQFSDADREAIARILTPRRAAAGTAQWEGRTGHMDQRTDVGELAADYYAAAALGMKLASPKRNGMRVSHQQFSYAANMRPRRLTQFRQYLDDWARRQSPSS